MKSIRRLVQEQRREEEGVLLLSESASPRVRSFSGFNGRGLWTLTMKEISRFAKIPLQTLFSPLVMTLLFYAVFALGMSGGHRMVGPVPFLSFLIPGLVMMSMAQNAFINTSSSLILSKIQGNIVDVLMPPLSPFELALGYAIGGLVRGLAVGALSIGAVALIAPVQIADIRIVLIFAVMGSLMLSLIGLITGIWGDKFDHLAAIQNFIIMPATFLSGTFFSVTSLPAKWAFLCHLNPFYYMIDGFRAGFTGYPDSDLLGGMGILLCINIALFNVAYWMFARGTGLKS